MVDYKILVDIIVNPLCCAFDKWINLHFPIISWIPLEHSDSYVIYIDFFIYCFSARSNFISPNEHQKRYFHWWHSHERKYHFWCSWGKKNLKIISPNVAATVKIHIPLLMFMTEIKFDLTLKKSNFLFLLCFYKCTITCMYYTFTYSSTLMSEI